MSRTFALVLLTAVAGAETRAAGPSVRALKALSVDRLLELEVTSVSKRREPLADAAASLYAENGAAASRTPVERTIVGQVRWQF